MRYWVYQDAQVQGPYVREDLALLPGLCQSTLLCEESSAGTEENHWRSLENFPELAPLIPNAQAVLAPNAQKETAWEQNLGASPSLASLWSSPLEEIDPLQEWDRIRARELEHRLGQLQEELTQYKRQQDEILGRLGDKDRRILELEQTLRSVNAPASANAPKHFLMAGSTRPLPQPSVPPSPPAEIAPPLAPVPPGFVMPVEPAPPSASEFASMPEPTRLHSARQIPNPIPLGPSIQSPEQSSPSTPMDAEIQILETQEFSDTTPQVEPPQTPMVEAMAKEASLDPAPEPKPTEQTVPPTPDALQEQSPQEFSMGEELIVLHPPPFEINPEASHTASQVLEQPKTMLLSGQAAEQPPQQLDTFEDLMTGSTEILDATERATVGKKKTATPVVKAGKPRRKQSRGFLLGLAGACVVLICVSLFFLKDPKQVLLMLNMRPPHKSAQIPGAKEAAAPNGEVSTKANPPVPSSSPEPLPVSAKGRDFIEDQGVRALEIVKNYPLNRQRGTIAQWLQYSFLTQGKEEEWSAGAYEAQIYWVTYYVFESGSGGRKEKPLVTYVFEVNLTNRTVTGKNPEATALLEGEPSKPAAQTRDAPVASSVRRRKRKLRSVPTTSLPSEEDMDSSYRASPYAFNNPGSDSFGFNP